MFRAVLVFSLTKNTGLLKPDGDMNVALWFVSDSDCAAVVLHGEHVKGSRVKYL